MRRIALLAAVVALVASACGGAADAEEGVATIDDTALLDISGTTAAPEMTEEEVLLAFTQCLRDNGLDIDDPTVDAEGNLRLSRPDGAGEQGQDGNEVFGAARQACRELLEGVTLGFRDVDVTELEDQLLAFAACVRDNGYESMPDPDLSGLGNPGQGGGGPFGELDRDDPAFQMAAEQCQDILAGFPREPGGGRGGQGDG